MAILLKTIPQMMLPASTKIIEVANQDPYSSGGGSPFSGLAWSNFADSCRSTAILRSYNNLLNSLYFSSRFYIIFWSEVFLAFIAVISHQLIASTVFCLIMLPLPSLSCPQLPRSEPTYFFLDFCGTDRLDDLEVSSYQQLYFYSNSVPY